MNRADNFPVVGISASAGGPTAFESFFSGMDPDLNPGIVCVLVQHLAPDHKSLLSELIQRFTRMPVNEVENGREVKPDCIYIIPPNTDMVPLEGRLYLLEPAALRGQRLPVDFFFRSLAEVTIHPENTLEKIFNLLQNRLGHDFPQYKSNTVIRRIG